LAGLAILSPPVLTPFVYRPVSSFAACYQIPFCWLLHHK